MKTVEFGELFQFMRNGMSIKQDKSGDGLPISRIETIADSSIDPTRVGYAGLSFDACKDWLLQEGDILFSHINSVEHIGKCAVYRGVPEQLVHGMNLLCFRPNPAQVTPEFAKYLIRSASFRDRLSNFVNKAVNQASVSIGNLRTIPVRMPPLEEQRRIAAILDQAEALRTQRRTALALLDSLTQSLFLDMFGDAETNKMGFQISTLGSAIKLKSGNFLPASQMADKGQFPVYGGNGINGKHDEFMFEEPKIVIGRVGAYCGCVHVTEPHSWVTDNALYIETFDSALHPEYLAFALSEAKLNQYASQSGQPLISGARIAAVKLLIPPLPLQQTFATRIASIEALKATHRRALAALDALFASLQQRAFAGQL